jgi:exopolyphosphatase/guanosine-5'-triphosphate,3'-diphosphate pyrophosphatase
MHDNTCYFLAADFDKGQWQDEVKAMSKACQNFGIPHAIEISRSGNGAHLWIFFNEKVLCGLGSDLEQTGRLSRDGRERALAAIRRFISLAERMKVTALVGVATAAMRDAEDGEEFRNQIEAATLLRVSIATGADEARLAAQGVLLGHPGADGIVSDLGGASMELTRVIDGRVDQGFTLALGPLRLARLGLDQTQVDAIVDRDLTAGLPAKWRGAETLYGVGGAWRALARLNMVRQDYPLAVVNDYELTRDEAIDVTDWAASEPLRKAAEAADISSQRMAVVPLAAQVIGGLVRRLAPERVVLSSFGLREGVLYDALSPEQRAEDPLIHACRELEAVHSRFPGFGDELFRWVTPLLEPGREARRLAHATCLLADVVWRAHPDYRSRACFETVTRANLCAVDHPGRVYMGVALLFRYKGGRKAVDREPSTALLSPDLARSAERLGRAIRLGSMISGSAQGGLASSHLSLTDDRLMLRLSGPSARLTGEVVERRLSSLASSLEREGVIEIA